MDGKGNGNGALENEPLIELENEEPVVLNAGESEGETRPNSSSELKESEMKKSRKDEKEVEQKEKSIVKPNVSDLNEKKSRFHFFRKKNTEPEAIELDDFNHVAGEVVEKNSDQSSSSDSEKDRSVQSVHSDDDTENSEIKRKSNSSSSSSRSSSSRSSNSEESEESEESEQYSQSQISTSFSSESEDDDDIEKLEEPKRKSDSHSSSSRSSSFEDKRKKMDVVTDDKSENEADSKSKSDSSSDLLSYSSKDSSEDKVKRMTVVKPKSKSSSSSSSSSSPKKIIPLQNPFEFENDFNEEIKPELEKSEESESEGKPEVKESKEEKFNRRKPDIGEGYMKGHKAAELKEAELKEAGHKEAELKEAELELGGAAIYILGSGDGTTAVKREGLTASMNMQFNRQAKGTFHKIEIEEEQKEEEQKEEGRKKEGQKKEGQKMSLGIELTGDNEEFIFFLKIGEKIYKDSRQICKYQLPPATPTQSREVSRIKGQVVKGPSLLKFDIENKENFYKRYNNFVDAQDLIEDEGFLKIFKTEEVGEISNAGKKFISDNFETFSGLLVKKGLLKEERVKAAKGNERIKEGIVAEIFIIMSEALIFKHDFIKKLEEGCGEILKDAKIKIATKEENKQSYGEQKHVDFSNCKLLNSKEVKVKITNNGTELNEAQIIHLRNFKRLQEFERLEGMISNERINEIKNIRGGGVEYIEHELDKKAKECLEAYNGKTDFDENFQGEINEVLEDDDIELDTLYEIGKIDYVNKAIEGFNNEVNGDAEKIEQSLLFVRGLFGEIKNLLNSGDSRNIDEFLNRGGINFDGIEGKKKEDELELKIRKVCFVIFKYSCENGLIECNEGEKEGKLTEFKNFSTEQMLAEIEKCLGVDYQKSIYQKSIAGKEREKSNAKQFSYNGQTRKQIVEEVEEEENKLDDATTAIKEKTEENKEEIKKNIGKIEGQIDILEYKIVKKQEEIDRKKGELVKNREIYEGNEARFEEEKRKIAGILRVDNEFDFSTLKEGDDKAEELKQKIKIEKINDDENDDDNKIIKINNFENSLDYIKEKSRILKEQKEEVVKLKNEIEKFENEQKRLKERQSQLTKEVEQLRRSEENVSNYKNSEEFLEKVREKKEEIKEEVGEVNENEEIIYKPIEEIKMNDMNENEEIKDFKPENLRDLELVTLKNEKEQKVEINSEKNTIDGIRAQIKQIKEGLGGLNELYVLQHTVNQPGYQGENNPNDVLKAIQAKEKEIDQNLQKLYSDLYNYHIYKIKLANEKGYPESAEFYQRQLLKLDEYKQSRGREEDLEYFRNNFDYVRSFDERSSEFTYKNFLTNLRKIGEEKIKDDSPDGVRAKFLNKVDDIKTLLFVIEKVRNSEDLFVDGDITLNSLRNRIGIEEGFNGESFARVFDFDNVNTDQPLNYEEFLKILRTRTSDLFSSMNEIMRDAFSGQILNDASEGASASVSLIQKYFMDAIKNKLFDFKLAIEEKENKVHYSYKVESNEFEITGLFEFTGTPVGLLEKIAQDDRLNGIIDNPSFADLKEQLKDNNFQEGLKEKFEELMGLIAERLKEQQDDKNLGENEYIMDYADEVIPFGCGAFTKGKKNRNFGGDKGNSFKNFAEEASKTKNMKAFTRAYPSSSIKFSYGGQELCFNMGFCYGAFELNDKFTQFNGGDKNYLFKAEYLDQEGIIYKAIEENCRDILNPDIKKFIIETVIEKIKLDDKIRATNAFFTYMKQAALDPSSSGIEYLITKAEEGGQDIIDAFLNEVLVPKTVQDKEVKEYIVKVISYASEKFTDIKDLFVGDNENKKINPTLFKTLIKNQEFLKEIENQLLLMKRFFLEEAANKPAPVELGGLEIKSQATHYLTQSTQEGLIGPNITEDYDAGKSAEQKKTRDNFIVRDGEKIYTISCTTPLNTSRADKNVVTFDVYNEEGELIGQKISKLVGGNVEIEYKCKKDNSQELETTEDEGKTKKLKEILGKLRICAKQNKMLNENANIYCKTEGSFLHKKFEGDDRSDIIDGNAKKLKMLKGNVESEDSVIAAKIKSKKDLSKGEIELMNDPYSKLKPERYGEIFGQKPVQQVLE